MYFTLLSTTCHVCPDLFPVLLLTAYVHWNACPSALPALYSVIARNYMTLVVQCTKFDIGSLKLLAIYLVTKSSLHQCWPFCVNRGVVSCLSTWLVRGSILSVSVVALYLVCRLGW